LITNLLNKLSDTWATYLLIIVNIIIFSTYGFERIAVITLFDLGGNFPPFSLDSEPFRLVTSMFLHGHLFHLFANMYGLFYVGMQLERKIGSVNFLIVYFLTGLFAGLASLNFNLFVVSVGASGAIFGVYGFLIVESIRKNPRNKVSILTNFIVYVVVVTLVGSRLNFDNAAHIGGAIAGLIIGILYGNLQLRLVYTGGMAAIIISYFLSPRDQVSYFKSYQNFISTDHHLSEIINARLSDKDFYDSLIRIKKLPKETIKDFRNIKFVPNKLTNDTTLIIRYLDLKSLQIDYFLQGLSKESFIYLDSIGLVAFKISKLPQIEYNLNFEIQPSRVNLDQDTTEQLFIVRQNYDSNWFEVDSFGYEYYRIGQKDSLGNWHGTIEDYFKDGAIQMKGSYHRGLKDGIFIYYESDSTYSAAGRYLSDNRIGKWEEYHRNGHLYSEIRHEKGFAYIENLWDSLGNQLVTNRNGEELYKHSNGVISYKREIFDGLNHGFIESYYKDGNLRFKEYHENGELIKGFSYFNKTENTYDGSVYIPYPEGGFESFYNYVEKTNELKSDSIDEIVVMRFDVHYSGKLNNIRFLKRYDEKYNQYAKELLLNGPKWIPARSHGLFEMSSFAEVTVNF
jgi:membrane associated rhomboid family serine protease/antitoxin component YwqK of YwqJK toxin-antitoxin module